MAPTPPSSGAAVEALPEESELDELPTVSDGDGGTTIVVGDVADVELDCAGGAELVGAVDTLSDAEAPGSDADVVVLSEADAVVVVESVVVDVVAEVVVVPDNVVVVVETDVDEDEVGGGRCCPVGTKVLTQARSSRTRSWPLTTIGVKVMVQSSTTLPPATGMIWWVVTWFGPENGPFWRVRRVVGAAWAASAAIAMVARILWSIMDEPEGAEASSSRGGKRETRVFKRAPWPWGKVNEEEKARVKSESSEQSQQQAETCRALYVHVQPSRPSSSRRLNGLVHRAGLHTATHPRPSQHPRDPPRPESLESDACRRVQYYYPQQRPPRPHRYWHQFEQ